MKEALQQLIAKMPSVNIGLSHPELITNITWLNLTHSEAGKKFVYIFRKEHKEMMVAHNGHITTGEWDFFPNSNSLALIYQGSSYLYNALLVDAKYLVLKQDAYEEGMLFVNQAHFIALLEEHGKEAMKHVYADLKALAVGEWSAKAKSRVMPKEEVVAPNTHTQPLPQEEKKQPQPQAEEKPLPKVEGAAPYKETSVPQEKNIESEEAAPKGGNPILAKYHEESKVADDDDDDNVTETPFNIPPKATLNDRLKEQLKQEKQPSLLEKLQEENKRK